MHYYFITLNDEGNKKMYRKKILFKVPFQSIMKESTAFLILQTLNSFQEKKLILLKENKNKPQNPHHKKIPLLYLLA